MITKGSLMAKIKEIDWSHPLIVSMLLTAALLLQLMHADSDLISVLIGGAVGYLVPRGALSGAGNTLVGGVVAAGSIFLPIFVAVILFAGCASSASSSCSTLLVTIGESHQPPERAEADRQIVSEVCHRYVGMDGGVP